MAELARRGLSRPLRWSLWLAAGALCGVAFGFVVGLARPRVRK